MSLDLCSVFGLERVKNFQFGYSQRQHSAAVASPDIHENIIHYCRDDNANLLSSSQLFTMAVVVETKHTCLPGTFFV